MIYSPIFNASISHSKHGYEFFKATHFFAAAMFILIFFWHCDYTLTSWSVQALAPKFLHGNR
jgi:hypothetical protein